MLRVTINQDHGEFVTLKIEGRLTGERVSELRRVWDSLAPSLGSKRVLIDLRDVMIVDTMGKQVLAEIHSKARAEFLADTPLTKHIAEEAQQGIRGKSN
jgi:anti-anti-sigma regulatory factor